MAGSLQGGGGVRRKRRGHRRSYTPMSEINVTPFVDVMLVLLIVFMVTAPLLTVGVPVDLPKSQASPISEDTEPLVITVDREGTIYIQETEVPFDNLVTRLNAITDRKPETRIFVRGDREIAYGQIMRVMGRLNGAGFENVALITAQDDQG
jgi:biopolymer transport protein TolR